MQFYAKNKHTENNTLPFLTVYNPIFPCVLNFHTTYQKLVYKESEYSTT